MLTDCTGSLICGSCDDSEYLKKAVTEEGSDDFTMFLRVNGEPIYARGANMVALDQFEGRTNDANYRRLIQSAADAGMNAFRKFSLCMMSKQKIVLLIHLMIYCQG